MVHLTHNDAAWSAKSYPVLALNAPTATGTKVVLPGDPTSLYAALAVLVERALSSRAPAVEGKRAELAEKTYFQTFVPDFGAYPTHEDRDRWASAGVLQKETPRTPDDCIFDPRMWNEDVEHELVELLRARKPRVVMISNTSLGHPYAVTMAKIVRAELPQSLIIVGGAHEDDTMRYVQRSRECTLSRASTLRSMLEGRIPNIFDIVISGDAEYALAYVCEAISETMDAATKLPSKTKLYERLSARKEELTGLPGFFCVGYIDEHDDLMLYASQGVQIEYHDLPPVYRLFSMKSRFDVFPRTNGDPKLTAHIITTRSCPRSCCYCSEGRAVQKNGAFALKSCAPEPSAVYVMNMIKQYVEYGAEAAFFDDSILFGGNRSRIIQFCRALHLEKEKMRNDLYEVSSVSEHLFAKRFISFEWGAQLTVEDLVDSEGEPHAHAGDLLAWLEKAGCTYLYFGVESLDENIMRGIDKHRYLPEQAIEYDRWFAKVNRALDLCRGVGIKVGVSVQFGLPGENDRTIDATIKGMAHLIRQGKVALISPNIATYHPGTPLTYMHNKSNLDYLAIPSTRKPYSLFEEASPEYSSALLDERQLWEISRRVYEEWRTINMHEGA